MKVSLKDKYSFSLTFIMNFVFLDWVWVSLETLLYGELRPSVEDSIMLVLFCLILASSYKREDKA